MAADDLICPLCHNPRSVCSDPDRPWYPQRSTCYATAAREQAQRMWDARRDGKLDGAVQQAGTAKYYQIGIGDSAETVLVDGTHVWVSPVDLTPDDNFL